MTRLFLALFALTASMAFAGPKALVIGAKGFTEAEVLGEWLAHEVERTDPVERRFGLAGTGIIFEALRGNELQLYVEYTGTLAGAVFHRPQATHADLARELAKVGLVMSEPLGFRSDFAIAVTAAFAEQHNLRRVSDLARVVDHARGAFSYEFAVRPDGLPGLAKRYGLQRLTTMPKLDHALVYEGFKQGDVDVADVFTTDAQIERLGLRILEDDRKFFLHYEAVILARADVVRERPALWARLQKLAGTLSDERVRTWNAGVDLERRSPAEVVTGRAAEGSRVWRELGRRAREHAVLVGVALLVSIALGIPLGIFAGVYPRLGQGILVGIGLVQTIPSLALLCFLIPVAGLGTGAALVALCLYGLLPIVANTVLGLRSVDLGLLEMADALRLTRIERLRHVELPLALSAVLAGVRTSAVISVGTATLAALIGAGGFGAPIMSGLATNDHAMIWAGALPAAAMALVVHGLFAVLGHVVIPRGLRR